MSQLKNVNSDLLEYFICTIYNMSLLLIYINFSFDFLSQNHLISLGFSMNMNVYMHSYHMLYLQHLRQCCIGYTISRLRLEIVYPIQHGRSCCK